MAFTRFLKKFGFIKMLIVVVLLQFGATCTYALPFLPKVYSTASFTSSAKIKDIRNANTNGFKIGVGVSAEGVPVPFFNGLRAEFDYLSAGRDLLNLGAYYDLHLIPFVTPYAGMSIFYANFKNIVNHGSLQQSLAGLHCGVSVTLPILPVSLIGEYQYMLPITSFNDKNLDRATINRLERASSLISIGFRLYFL